jgi:hypothetical protein
MPGILRFQAEIVQAMLGLLKLEVSEQLYLMV